MMSDEGKKSSRLQSVTMTEKLGQEKDEIKRKKVIWTQWIAASTLSLMLFVVGLGNGWSSPYLAKLALQDNVDGIPKASDDELSWIASLMNIGRIFGAVAGAIAQDTIGRKHGLYFSGIPMMTGWVCIAVAKSVEWLYAARVCCGFSMGIVWTTLSHYLAEIADPEIRGSLVLWNIASQSIGLFVGNLMGPYMSMKMFAYFCIAVNFLYLVLFPLIPDTPTRHVMMGDLSKAEKSLQWFRRTNDVKDELNELQEYVSSSKSSFKERWRELKEPRYRKSFMMMSLINVFLYFSAYNVINNYMEIILTNSKVNLTPSIIVTSCGLFSVFASLLATFLVDKFGRRLLLISSSLGMAVSLTCLGLHFKLLHLGFDPVKLTWLPCTCILGYTVSYSAGVGCIPSALVGELFSPRLKSIASLSFSGSAAVFSSLSTMTFLPFLSLVGDSYLFWFYSAGVYVSALYYYCYAPETMGKSLKDIQQDNEKK